MSKLIIFLSDSDSELPGLFEINPFKGRKTCLKQRI